MATRYSVDRCAHNTFAFFGRRFGALMTSVTRLASLNRPIFVYTNILRPGAKKCAPPRLSRPLVQASVPRGGGQKSQNNLRPQLSPPRDFSGAHIARRSNLRLFAVQPLSADFAERHVNLDELTTTDLQYALELSLIETSNGLAADRLRFCSSHLDQESVKSVVDSALNQVRENSSFSWTSRAHWCKEEGEYSLIVLPEDALNSHTASASSTKDVKDRFVVAYPSLSRYEQALRLDRLGYQLESGPLDERLLVLLKSIAESDSLLTSTLASEILTRHGEPTVPVKAIEAAQRSPSVRSEAASEGSKSKNSNFEDRISVDAYNFFELVHPSYFKQTVALAEMVIRHCGHLEGRQCIDVGTGPGTNLLAFLEMVPQLSIVAVEPSNAAFAYLAMNTSAHKQVDAKKTGFLELPIPTPVPLIISTGASHHFNTRAFFRKAFESLENGGLFIIADEMVSRYRTRTERKLNLIDHHLSYMVALCFSLSEEVDEGITDRERCLVRSFRNDVPLAKFYAAQGSLTRAEGVCRDLLRRSSCLELGIAVSHPLLAFYRLQLLELEACVAGLDYEVEQKTFPEQLKSMAKQTGFDLVEHKRVHGTTGLYLDDAGTHVISFRKV